MASFLLLSATGELVPGALAVLMSDNALRRIADMRSSVSPALVFKGLGFDNVVAPWFGDKPSGRAQAQLADTLDLDFDLFPMSRELHIKLGSRDAHPTIIDKPPPPASRDSAPRRKESITGIGAT